MLKNMKPLPKALLIAVIVGVPVFAYVKLVPQKPPMADVGTVTPTPVPSEAALQANSAAVPPTQASMPSPQVTVTPSISTSPDPVGAANGLTPAGGQDAGLAAALKAGQK